MSVSGAFVGRLLVISRVGTGPGPAIIAGKTTKDISINNGEIDITSDDDEGFRTLLEQSKVRSVDIEMSGVIKDQDLLEFAFAGPIQGEYEVDFGGLGTLTGTFQISDMKVSAPHDDKSTFTVSMKSSGAFEYVRGATVSA